MASDLGLAAVMALAARVVREATEPDAVKAALGAVVCLLQPECTEVRHVGPTGTGDAAELVRQVAELLTTAPRTELARVFVARYYTRWAALLLGPSLVSWLSLLSRAASEAERGDRLPHLLLIKRTVAIVVPLAEQVDQLDLVIPHDRKQLLLDRLGARL